MELGIGICEGEYYDTQPAYAGTIYICMAVLYGLVSGFFMWTTVHITKRYQLLHNPMLFLLYLSLNAILLFRLFYFLGGILICYSEAVYEVLIASAPGIFKEVAFLLYIARIFFALQQIEPPHKTLYTVLRLITLVLSCIVPMVSLVLALYSYYAQSKALYVYVLVVHGVLMGTIIGQCVRMVLGIKRTTVGELGKEALCFVRMWVCMNSLLVILLILWAIHVSNNMLHYLAGGHTLMYVVWAALFLQLPEMIAVIIITFFFVSIRPSSHTASRRSSSFHSFRSLNDPHPV